MVVEYATCAEGFHVLEVLWRRSGEDFIAGRDGELDCVTADARCASPDQVGLSIGHLRRLGWELEGEEVGVEEA